MTETTEEMMKRLNAARMTPVVTYDIDPDFDEIPRATTNDRTVPVFVREGYDSLFIVLCKALHQAQDGKGKDRHAQPGQAFEDQPIMAIGQLVGAGFQNGQAIKKMVEAQGMVSRGEYAAAEREVLGAINYLAATALRINQISVNKMEKN